MHAIVSAEVARGLVMAVQDFLVRVLTGQTIEVAMDGIRVAAYCFKLDGHMLDPELSRDPASDRLKQIAGESLVIPVNLNVRRHHDEAWLDRPNVQVVDILPPWNGFDGSRDLRGADTGGGGLQ